MNGAAPAGFAPAPVFDPYDHTAEYDAQDISDAVVLRRAVQPVSAALPVSAFDDPGL